MAVRRECTKIGHAVPWTVDASLITLSGPPGFAPGGFRALVWMPFGARSSRAAEHGAVSQCEPSLGRVRDRAPALPPDRESPSIPFPEPSRQICACAPCRQ
jgi:hypothetical protein